MSALWLGFMWVSQPTAVLVSPSSPGSGVLCTVSTGVGVSVGVGSGVGVSPKSLRSGVLRDHPRRRCKLSPHPASPAADSSPKGSQNLPAGGIRGSLCRSEESAAAKLTYTFKTRL